MNANRVTLALLLAASSAGASPAYPGAIESELHIETLPASGQGCVLCHATESGGANTVDRPFGRSMRSLGARGRSDVGSLVAALRSAEAQGTDSDADGISDIDELRAHRDPNVPQATEDGGVVALPEQPPLLETGCAVHVSASERAPQRAPAALTAATAVGIAGMRRRSSRRTRTLRTRREKSS
jgi:hypothetical protein